MISKWKGLLSSDGTCEVDVWPFLQNLTCDVISRTAFGSSYAEGTKLFQLLKKQGVLLMTELQTNTPLWYKIIYKVVKYVSSLIVQNQKLVRKLLYVVTHNPKYLI